jgi:hypothetical protein
MPLSLAELLYREHLLVSLERRESALCGVLHASQFCAHSISPCASHVPTVLHSWWICGASIGSAILYPLRLGLHRSPSPFRTDTGGKRWPIIAPMLTAWQSALARSQRGAFPSQDETVLTTQPIKVDLASSRLSPKWRRVLVGEWVFRELQRKGKPSLTYTGARG